MIDTMADDNEMSKKMLTDFLPALYESLDEAPTVVYLDGEAARDYQRKLGIDPFMHPFPYLMF